MKLLFFEWNAFMQNDIEKILRQLPQIELTCISYEFKNVDEDPLFMERFPGELLKEKYDLVFSVNFFPLVSDVCTAYGITYVSWVYDSPMNVRKISSYNNPVNRIYVFDGGLYDELKKTGVNTVFHKPLGVDTKKILTLDEDDEQGRLRADISFVGRLYSSEFDYMTGPLTQKQKKELEELINAQTFNYKQYLIADFLTGDYMTELNNIYKTASGNPDYSVSRAEFEFLMASEVTRRERLAALKALGEKYPVTLYSYDSLPQVQNKGVVNYYTEMPKVFKNSKINLNITLKIIKTGMPLRVMDIFGAGGFLLSNYQKELADFYENKKEVVMYDNLNELCELAGYYLSNDAERKAIAAAGRKRTGELFELKNMLTDLLL